MNLTAITLVPGRTAIAPGLESFSRRVFATCYAFRILSPVGTFPVSIAHRPAPLNGFRLEQFVTLTPMSVGPTAAFDVGDNE